MIRLAVLVPLAGAACGASFETWQTFEALLHTWENTNVVIHSQFRQRNRLHDLFYARFGPVLRQRLSLRTTLVSGYYFGEAEDDRRWGSSHRTFGGVEMPFSSKVAGFSVRHLVEHHFGGSESPELRNRTLVEFNRPGRSWTPFVGSETFFDQNGFIQHRLQGGVRIPLTSSYRMDVTYLYDWRVTRLGENRHVIQTAFRPRSKD